MLNDLTGQKFGLWTVEYKSERKDEKGRHAIWHCRCACGTEKDVNSTNLTQGKSTSCGCTHVEDLKGQAFGKWTVLSRADKTNDWGGHAYWNCRCACGTERVVCSKFLKSGRSLSCGCSATSRLETQTTKYLDAMNLSYEIQKKFDELNGIGGKQLSYDFDVIIGEQEYLIECQGEQHYHSIKFFGGEKNFENQKAHDELKRDYAAKHNMQLIEVPYTCRTYKSVSEFLKANGICSTENV